MPIDLQPSLRGRLIELRPLRPDDFEALFEAANDPLIWQQHPEPDRYKREVFQKFLDGAVECKGALTVVDQASGRIIGSSRYWGYDAAKREIEIGWTFLERAYWGGSYNAELKSLMLQHVFQFVDRVIFRVGENNLRSQKALAKIGARLLARLEPGSGASPLNNLIFVIDHCPAGNS